MKVYAKVGDNAQLVDEADLGCPEGWIEMQAQRPDDANTLDYTAQPDGTWRVMEETIVERLKPIEREWQTTEMAVIANQLLALEEEADDTLPGTRKQWLAYRTQVRLWHESPEFPDQAKRPARPA
ncbi:hypothetical protein [Pseudomonas gingeri]